MIDTLYLHFDRNKKPNSFSLTKKSLDNLTLVQRHSPLKEALSGTNQKGLVYASDRGKDIEGHKAFHNSPDGIYISDISNNILFTKLSVPRVHSGTHNFSPIDLTETRKVFDKVQDYYSGIGIEMNMKEAEIGRIDLFNNCTMDMPCINYAPTFKAMTMKREKKYAEYHGGFETKNKSHGYCLYDKGKALKALHKVDIKQDNICRSEYRLTNKRKVSETLGLVKLTDLLDNYGKLPNIYRTALKENIFRHNTIDCELEIRDQVEHLKLCHQQSPRGGLNNWLSSIGLTYILAEYGMEGFKEIVTSVYSRQHFHKVIKKLHMFSGSLKGLSVAHLYKELKEKALDIKCA